MSKTDDIIAKTEQYGAANYHPLPVVLVRGEGVWVWDVEGKKYMDMLSAYSALSHGHRHPKIIAALIDQANQLTLTSRAFHNDKLAGMYERLAKMTGLPKILPMNSGAEAVETAIKAVRKWGYSVKGVARDKAEIIVCHDNFHGRTVTIVSFSTEEAYRDGFGPLTPGFKVVPYDDSDALAAAMNENTVAVLVEPIQGEAGIRVPKSGYLAEVERICRENRALLVVDEIQVGLGRTGKDFCFEHDGVKPDVVIIGKALGGGIMPVSAIAATEEVMSVFKPGEHGSTFGGNPIAAAVASAAIDVIKEERLTERSAELGQYLVDRLRQMKSPHIQEVRGRGLLVGVDLKPEAGGARRFCESLMQRGLLCKETHESVIRLAPPLIISKDELDWAISEVGEVLS